MRVLLLSYGSRGDVGPMAALAVRLRELGVEARVCAPPDFAELLDRIGVPLVPVGSPVRAAVRGAVTGTAPRPAQSLPQRAAELIGRTYDAVAEAAGDCDAVVATGLVPAAAAARSAAERLGIRYVFASFFPTYLPSPHHPPLPWPGRPLPADVTDNRVLWDLNAESMNALFGEALNTHRASIGLPPVDSVREYVFTHRPWLAADPTLGPWPQPADLGAVQTGAWLLPDERPLPDDVQAFLDAGAPPVYVGFGSIPVRDPAGIARAAVEAIRGQGRRALISRGWADLAPIDDRGDCCVVGEANHQALFKRVAAVVHHGGAGTTTTAALAGAPQVVVPQLADQPYWAGRVADLGIGAAHAGATPTADSLSDALTTALAPTTRARAAAVAGRIRTDGAAVAAGLLLDTIRRGGPATPREPRPGRRAVPPPAGSPGSHRPVPGDSAPAAGGPPNAADSGTWQLGDRTVHRLGLGAMRLTGTAAFHGGVPRDRDASVALVRRAVELGVDHIDTAAFYFSALRSANEIVNAALAPFGDEVLVATKVGPRRERDGSWADSARPDQLRADVEENLRQLGRDHLDLVYLRTMRWPSIAEHFGALAELREAGLVRHLGVSEVTPEQLAEARAIAPVAAVQNRFGLGQADSAEVLRACGRAGIAFVPFFAVAGARASGPAPDPADSPEHPAVQAVARAHGATTQQIRLAWTLAQGPHVLAIPGTGDPAHLEANIAAGAIQLSPDDLARLDAAA